MPPPPIPNPLPPFPSRRPAHPTPRPHTFRPPRADGPRRLEGQSPRPRQRPAPRSAPPRAVPGAGPGAPAIASPRRHPDTGTVVTSHSPTPSRSSPSHQTSGVGPRLGSPLRDPLAVHGNALAVTKERTCPPHGDQAVPYPPPPPSPPPSPPPALPPPSPSSPARRRPLSSSPPFSPTPYPLPPPSLPPPPSSLPPPPPPPPPSPLPPPFDHPFSRTPQTSDSDLIFDQVELPSTDPFT